MRSRQVFPGQHDVVPAVLQLPKSTTTSHEHRNCSISLNCLILIYMNCKLQGFAARFSYSSAVLQWLTYWIIFSILQSLEVFFYYIITWYVRISFLRCLWVRNSVGTCAPTYTSECCCCGFRMGLILSGDTVCDCTYMNIKTTEICFNQAFSLQREDVLDVGHVAVPHLTSAFSQDTICSCIVHPYEYHM
jgi:hypothetical protein